MYGTLPKRMVMLAVSVMLAGAFVAAWHDMTFDTMSLVLLVITNTFGVTYVVSVVLFRCGVFTSCASTVLVRLAVAGTTSSSSVSAKKRSSASCPCCSTTTSSPLHFC